MSVSISEIEQLLCAPRARGMIEEVIPRLDDAWDVRFPDLKSLPRGAKRWRKLRICIATEEVAGPVRNGGIGTTYAALAELIAQLGHDCTILYLRGDEIETGQMDHWVSVYAAKGVRLVPVADYAAGERFRSHADRWLRASYNMMRYLQLHPMDVVHVSEWRGCGYLSLLAKRQGLAFADTLFLVKTSSPWMWNRLYGALPIERTDDLVKNHAERNSVELADVVIGGSLHLLRWMSSQGYRIPRERAFVQPNVVSFENLSELLNKRVVERGARMAFDEIVFFGRLEGRKGLFVFCQAISRLLRMGQPLPPKITFMGKAGARLASRPDVSILDFIAEATRDWPVEVKILTEFQQYQALEYLLDGPRLAVMPSVIENSSMAVYEAAICGIPCVASDVGGNTELVEEADWPHVFCKPHPLSLGDRLAEAINLGGYVPNPSFDNDANLETWRLFHDSLARGLREQLLQASLTSSPIRAPEPPPPPSFPERLRHLGEAVAERWRGLRAAAADLSEREADPGAPGVSVCIYAVGEPDALRATLESLRQQSVSPIEIHVAVDADHTHQLEEIRAIGSDAGIDWRRIDASDLDAGAAFNRAAWTTRGELILFLWEGSTLRVDALDTLMRVAEDRGADVLNYLYRSSSTMDAQILHAPVITSVTDGFFREEVAPAPLLVRRGAFDTLGGFTGDHRALGYDIELINEAQLSGLICETVLQDLGAVNGPAVEWLARRGYDLSASRFRAIRPLLASAPLALRDLLLASLGLQARGGAGAAAGGRTRGQRFDSTFEEPFTELMRSILSEDQPRRRVKRGKAQVQSE